MGIFEFVCVVNRVRNRIPGCGSRPKVTENFPPLGAFHPRNRVFHRTFEVFEVFEVFLRAFHRSSAGLPQAFRRFATGKRRILHLPSAVPRSRYKNRPFPANRPYPYSGSSYHDHRRPAKKDGPSTPSEFHVRNGHVADHPTHMSVAGSPVCRQSKRTSY